MITVCIFEGRTVSPNGNWLTNVSLNVVKYNFHVGLKNELFWYIMYIVRYFPVLEIAYLTIVMYLRKLT